MAFPTIPTAGAGTVITGFQANTTSTRTFPNLSGLTNNSGDLMIAICAVYQSSASAGAVFSGWTSGWTEFADLGGTTSNMSIGMAYKFSTGGETGAITVTQAATITGHAAMTIIAIPGAHATAAPEHTAIANATAAAADPAALSPSWGADDTLWVAVGSSGETAITGSWTGMGAAPTNYGNFAHTAVTDTSTVGQADVAVAFRQLNAASENVAGFSVDTSNARNSAVVVAVRPPPFVPVAPVVQSASHQAPSGNCSVTTSAAVSSGTKLIAYVMVSASSGSEPVTSVKDAAANTWTRLKSVQDSSTTGWLELFALDTPAGDVGSTVTLTATCTTNFGVNMLVQEVSGLLAGNTSAMLDGTPATNSGASTGPATTSAYSSAVTGEFLVAMMGDPGFSITVTDSSGYNADRNNINGSSTANLLVDYKASTGGAESASFTLTGGSDHWTTMLGAFQLASTGVSCDVAASTTATITATATAAELGAAAPSTTAAVTATMTAAELAAAARSATATITAAATAAELGAAAVSSTATITVAATVTPAGISGDAALTTTATLTATATAAELAAAALTTTATVTATATAAELAAAARSSTATITATATAAELAAAARSTTATITATATAAELAAAAVATTATITASATTGAAPVSADAALTTTATITATATAAEQAAATGPSTTATITAAGTLTARAAAAVTTTAVITPAMTAALHAAAALNALAVLTADAGSHPPNVPATSVAAVFAAVTSAASATDPRDGASTVTAAVTSTAATTDPRDGTAAIAAATTSSPTVT